ncbi:hypothetical protein [Candidatus Marithrix sp. Canyon 246]|uniref:hypothetical protein n=2 Tax=Candidatus Marithrix sp. Canyon 246 TaxID=1827136 RepID=UPI00084A17B4|nr:hypothetical protein [Candidatus Marithrix sp. Canyon 246]
MKKFTLVNAMVLSAALSGNVLADLNDGTVNGATLIEDRFGNNGSAYSFDGSNDYILIGDKPSLRMDGSFTVIAWVKSDLDSFYHPKTRSVEIPCFEVTTIAKLGSGIEGYD